MNRFAMAWFWSLLADIGLKLASAITVLAYYQFFGSVAGAEIIVSYSYVMAAWVFIDLGLGLYGAREVARFPERKSKLLLEITMTRLLLCFPVCTLLVLGLMYGPGLDGLQTSLFVAFLVFRAFAVEWCMRGEERFRELSAVTQTALVFQLMTLVIVLWLGEEGKAILPLPFTVWSIFFAVLSWRRYDDRVWNLLSGGLGSAIGHLRQSSQLCLVNGASVLTQQLPLIFLSFTAPVSSYAGFALLHRLALSGTTVFVSLGSAVFPRFVRNVHADYNKALRYMVRVAALIAACALLLGVILFLIARIDYVRETFLPEIEVTLLLIMIGYLVFRSIRIIPMRFLVAAELQGAALKVTLATSILSALLLVGFVWGDRLSPFRAGTVFLAIELMILSAMSWQCWHFRRSR